MNPSEFSDPHAAGLAALLGFTPGDLAANRAGKLTEAQVERLRRDAFAEYGTVIRLLGGIAFLAGTTYLYAHRILLLGIMGVLLVLMGLVVCRLISERRGLASREVESTPLESSPAAKNHRPRRREFFTIRPGWQLFADGDLSSVLHPDQTYRAYYVPFRSPATDFRILSLEPDETGKIM